jgi:hypothetical protein
MYSTKAASRYSTKAASTWFFLCEAHGRENSKQIEILLLSRRQRPQWPADVA